MWTNLLVEIISSTPPSKKVFLITSAQVTNFLQNDWSFLPFFSRVLIKIFSSILTLGYFCSNVIGNLSKNASLSTLVPINFPSSLPCPLVLAVAITLNPSAGFTNLLIFLTKIPEPSRIGCKHIILLLARSISSSKRIAPLSIASITGPFCQTVCPSLNL